METDRDFGPEWVKRIRVKRVVFGEKIIFVIMADSE